jgi:PiT family inorganic phosphate transporter
MHEGIFLIGVIIILAILYDFTNGWNDAANAIATVVSTKVLTPMVAVLFAAVLNVLGAFYNTEVAKTIGKGIVDPKFLPQ